MWRKRRRPHPRSQADLDAVPEATALNEQIKPLVMRLQTHSDALRIEVARLIELTESPRPGPRRSNGRSES